MVQEFLPSKDRGRRESRVPVAPAASCAVGRKHTSSHHRFTGTPGLPCAMVLTVSFALSSVIGLYCHRRLRRVSGPLGLTSPFRKLDASVEASGPHDFAVRVSAASSARRRRVHRIPPQRP